jgi:hypothetical protein
MNLSNIIRVFSFVVLVSLFGCSHPSAPSNSNGIYGTWTANITVDGTDIAPSINLQSSSHAVVTQVGQTVTADSVWVGYPNSDTMIFVEWWATLPNSAYQKWDAVIYVSGDSSLFDSFIHNEGTYPGDPNTAIDHCIFYLKK